MTTEEEPEVCWKYMRKVVIEGRIHIQVSNDLKTWVDFGEIIEK